jgi:hypothetical protein
MRKKILGIGVGGGYVVEFNIRLYVEYRTYSGEVIEREVVIPVQTTDREIANAIAIEKAKKMLENFSSINKNTITIKVKERKKKGKV